MQAFPEILFRFEPGCEPEAIIDGRPVMPRARIELDGREVFVLDFIMAWAREEARSEADRDRALDYIRYYIDEPR
jgi:hypothetical protein